MSSESKPVIGSLPGISSWKPPATAGTSTVGQLLDIWKYLSREKEIPLVEKTLSERESGARRERESAQEEQSGLEIENVKLKDELKNLRREYDNLTENKIRLEEEKKVLDGRERRSEERYKKINEELLKEQEEKCKLIFSLKKEIEKLKSEKNEAAMKLEASEKRFQLLEERYSRLEKYIAVKEGKMAENRYGDWISDNGTHPASTPDAMGSCRSKMKDASSIIVASPVVVLSDSDEERPVDEGASLANLCGSEVLGQTEKSSSTHKSQEKKEERVVKRKRSLRKSHDGGVSPQKKMYVQDLQDHRVSSRSSSRGDGSKGGAVAPSKGGSSMDSEDSATYLESQKAKGRGPWLLEPDMCLAFGDDLELCMDAVCALYRLQLSLPLSSKCLDKELDIVRVAKYLIHDHPENKLKRSVTEVSKDMVGDCKRLALHHSGELFRVYCSGKDPFFCYNAICSKF